MITNVHFVYTSRVYSSGEIHCSFYPYQFVQSQHLHNSQQSLVLRIYLSIKHLLLFI